jgi:hypothetical protein
MTTMMTVPQMTLMFLGTVVYLGRRAGLPRMDLDRSS